MKDLKTFINESNNSYKEISCETMEGFKRVLTPCVYYDGTFGVIVGQVFRYKSDAKVDKKTFNDALTFAIKLGYKPDVMKYESIASWWMDAVGEDIDEGQPLCFASIGEDEAFALCAYGGEGVTAIK